MPRKQKGFGVKIEWVDPNTPDGQESWDDGLRILADMIAQSHNKRRLGKRQQLNNNNTDGNSQVSKVGKVEHPE